MNEHSVTRPTPTAEIVRRMQSSKTFVAPVSDYLLGRRMFRDAIPFRACTTPAMRLGWDDAAEAAFDLEYQHGGIASMEALAEVLQ